MPLFGFQLGRRDDPETRYRKLVERDALAHVGPDNHPLLSPDEVFDALADLGVTWSKYIADVKARRLELERAYTCGTT